MKYFRFGIYHIKVIGANNKLFTTNNDDWYTHIDLNWAKEIGCTLELIEHPNNSLIWEKEQTKAGSHIFKKYVDYVFKFKKGYDDFKPILNRLWGALTRTVTTNINVRENSSIEIFAEKDILYITPSSDGKGLKIELTCKQHYYDNSFARIKPFITAKARYMLAKKIRNDVDNVVYIHTDGVIITKRISKDIKIGKELGDLKNEGKALNCVVTNCNGAKGDFNI